jgi:hypothetical protein
MSTALQLSTAVPAAAAPERTTDGLPDLAQELMAKASEISIALEEQQGKPALRYARSSRQSLYTMIQRDAHQGSALLACNWELRILIRAHDFTSRPY